MQNRAYDNEAYLTENGMLKKKKNTLKTEAHTRYGNLKTQYYQINNPKPQTLNTQTHIRSKTQKTPNPYTK